MVLSVNTRVRFDRVYPLPYMHPKETHTNTHSPPPIDMVELTFKKH